MGGGYLGKLADRHPAGLIGSFPFNINGSKYHFKIFPIRSDIVDLQIFCALALRYSSTDSQASIEFEFIAIEIFLRVTDIFIRQPVISFRSKFWE